MRRLVVLLLAGLTAVAAACGSDANAAEIVRASAAKTAAANTARMALTYRTTGSAATAVTAEGEFDFDSRQGRVTADTSGILGGAGGGTFEAITDADATYVKVPPTLAAQFGVSKPWIKLDLGSVGAQLGLGEFAQASQGDPGQVLDFLRGASDDVEKVGQETVRGTATTHYRATLDLRRAADRLSGAERDRLQRGIRGLPTTKVPTDVWIDDAGRVRKMHVTQGPTATTVELYDFGTPVDVHAPPADQVVDLGQLLPGKA